MGCLAEFTAVVMAGLLGTILAMTLVAWGPWLFVLLFALWTAERVWTSSQS